MLFASFDGVIQNDFLSKWVSSESWIISSSVRFGLITDIIYFYLIYKLPCPHSRTDTSGILVWFCLRFRRVGIYYIYLLGFTHRFHSHEWMIILRFLVIAGDLFLFSGSHYHRVRRSVAGTDSYSSFVSDTGEQYIQLHGYRMTSTKCLSWSGYSGGCRYMSSMRVFWGWGLDDGKWLIFHKIHLLYWHR